MLAGFRGVISVTANVAPRDACHTATSAITCSIAACGFAAR